MERRGARILRVVRETERGEFEVEAREFAEPFGVEETCEVLAEALSESGTLQGVVGVSISVGDGLGGDWLMRPEWWLLEPGTIDRLLRAAMYESQEAGRLIQRVFVWAPREPLWNRKLVGLLSGGEVKSGSEARAVSNEELSYGTESRWHKPEGEKPMQGELEL